MKTPTLSPRETAIARLVAKGWSNRQIAARERMLEQSVKNTLSQIYRKLGLDNRVQLTLLVTRLGSQRKAGRTKAADSRRGSRRST